MADTQPDLFQGCLTFDTVTTPRADGSYIVRPGRLRRIDNAVDVATAAKLSTYSPRHMRRIARQLGAGQRGPRCKLRIPAVALDRMMKTTAAGEG